MAGYTSPAQMPSTVDDAKADFTKTREATDQRVRGYTSLSSPKISLHIFRKRFSLQFLACYIRFATGVQILFNEIK